MGQKKEFVDPNFIRQDSVSEDDTQWYDARELSLYGLMPDEEHLRRMPEAIAAASRPGNTYESFISQAYNLDYRNLGFAGSAKGEQTMAEFIAGLPMCVCVCDYDHNAPTLEHYKATHYAFYETIRKHQPDVPYIVLSRPTYFMDPVVGEQRKQVTLESYERARANGDQNVYFIDGSTLYEGDFYESCTTDGWHPNDLGFFRIAQKLGPVIAKVMGIA